jgi:hypothetical protein
VTTDRVEQLKARLKREDEAKEEAFQKRLAEIKESQAEFRAEQEEKERAEEQKRKKLHDDLRQKRERDEGLRTPLLGRCGRNEGSVRAGVAGPEERDAKRACSRACL